MKFFEFFRRKPREVYDYGETVFTDADYRVTFRSGDSNTAILAFCGIGLGVGGIQIEEFRASLGSMASVYFIADLKRSWWNDGRIETCMAAAIEHARSRDPRVSFSAIGNSMGGSGAILAASLYPEIRRCLAFVPQADVQPASAETRWKKYRKRIGRHRWSNFLLPSAGAETLIVFGASDDLDSCNQFRAAGFQVEVVADSGHGVASHLRDAEPERYWDMIRVVAMVNAPHDPIPAC